MVYINDIPFGNKCYPNNERMYDLIHINSDQNVITVKYETDLDISSMIVARHYIKDKAIEAKLILNIPYFPYSRMDREIDTDKEKHIFTLKYMVKTIIDLEFDLVILYDPHSEVLFDLFTGKTESCFVYNIELISRIFKTNEFDYIFFPDDGAVERYKDMYSLPSFHGSKVRENGIITDFKLVNPPELTDKKILIVDDLCSKGGTFLASAELLKRNGAKEVSLFVTHCEPTVFKGSLLNSDLISNLYTTDTLISGYTHKKIKIYENPSIEWIMGLHEQQKEEWYEI